MSGPTRTMGASREERIATILTSAGYREYLRVMSRFHGYSFNNVMLVMLQRPDATRVAGFQTWRRMGRRVKQGEKGIRIMVPYRTKVSREDDASDPFYVLRGFGIGVVFDLSQTEGTPLPEGLVVREPEGEHAEAERIMTALTRHVVTEGVTIVRAGMERHRGYWHPTRREIGIRSDLVGISAAKTLCHEVAHFLADHWGNVARGVDPVWWTPEDWGELQEVSRWHVQCPSIHRNSKSKPYNSSSNANVPCRKSRVISGFPSKRCATG